MTRSVDRFLDLFIYLFTEYQKSIYRSGALEGHASDAMLMTRRFWRGGQDSERERWFVITKSLMIASDRSHAARMSSFYLRKFSYF